MSGAIEFVDEVAPIDPHVWEALSRSMMERASLAAFPPVLPTGERISLPPGPPGFWGRHNGQ